MKLKIGSVLSEHLKRKHLTLRTVSRATGISHTTISEWASNRMPKDPEKVRKVAVFLGISLHELLFGEPDPNEGQLVRVPHGMFEGVFQVIVKDLNIGGK